MKYILEGIIHREPRRLQTHFSDIPLVRNYRQKQTVFAHVILSTLCFLKHPLNNSAWNIPQQAVRVG